MLRFLFKVVVLVALLAGAWVYFQGSGTNGRFGASPTAGTSGRGIDTRVARERGAEIGERVATAANRMGDALSDGALTAKIKSKMALDDTIKSRDIRVATSDAVVTLSGKVGSAAERDRAVQLARETDGVKSVTDQLQIAK
jgi:osmotically-inducible protein OsmY